MLSLIFLAQIVHKQINCQIIKIYRNRTESFSFSFNYIYWISSCVVWLKAQTEEIKFIDNVLLLKNISRVLRVYLKSFLRRYTIDTLKKHSYISNLKMQEARLFVTSCFEPTNAVSLNILLNKIEETWKIIDDFHTTDEF